MFDVGFNYRITDLQCALGISQMKKLNKFISSRRQIAKIYNKILGENSNCSVPYEDENVKHAYHLYPVQAEFDNLKNNKITFFKKMKSKGIQLQVHYIPVHLQPYYKKNFKFKYGDFPISEKFYKNEFSIPIYPSLKKSDINKIVGEINRNLV